MTSSQGKRRLRRDGGANRKPALHSKAFALFYQDRNESPGGKVGQKRGLPGFPFPGNAEGVRAITNERENTQFLDQITRII